jgi:rhodanese-related sulfurtransferase
MFTQYLASSRGDQIVASQKSMTAADIRRDLMVRSELAIVDVRDESVFALGHPLFATPISLANIEIEVPLRVPRSTSKVVVYDNGEGLAETALAKLRHMGYSSAFQLDGGLAAWQEAGFELFQDVNSYSKAFGELVEHRRQTPSLDAKGVQALRARGEPMVILDVRRFDEFEVMSIPGAISVPGAELVLRARSLAPDPSTRIIVNCAGRTRSLIGCQSLINAGIPNRVDALKNGTIGWILDGQELEHGQSRSFCAVTSEQIADAQRRASEVAYRAGVRCIDLAMCAHFRHDNTRTTYFFDVRTLEEHLLGHPPGFRHVPGGQLVQETDMFASTRGGRIVLADNWGSRALMTASWLAQMSWEVYVVFGSFEGRMHTGLETVTPLLPNKGRYKRPYEGTSNATDAMQAYLEWEYGLVQQLAHDGTHGFFVI